MLRQDDALLLVPAPVPEAAGRPPRDDPADERPGAATGFTGRADLLARTARLVQDAAAGAGRVLLVSGEPGVGKTRFASVVAEQAQAAGLRALWGGWEPEGCPPLWGWARALGDGVVAAGAQADTASTTVRQADLVLERLTRDGGSCLVLDDVQWADDDSHRLLRRLAATVAGTPVLVVVLCREPAASRSPATEATLAALARLGADRVRLTGLEPGELRRLVATATGLEIGPATAEQVHGRTGGNPFYVHELVRLLLEEGVLGDPDGPAWQRVPHGVRDTVRHRLAELPEVVRDVVAAAAVLGRTAHLDVLEAYWEGGYADLDESLDAALGAGLLAEDGTESVRFAHALVRDAVYGELSPLARRRMHARAAVAIERCRVGSLDEHAASLAEHYRLAGPVYARSAWTCAARAAGVAAAAGSHAEAARLLGSAAQLQPLDELLDAGERERVHTAWGTALRRSGLIAQAWEPLEVAAVSALQRGDGRAAAAALLVVTEDVLWSWRTRHEADEQAVALWLRVLAALPEREDGLRARVLAALSVEVLHDPPGGRCEDWAEQALALSRRSTEVEVRIAVLQVVLNALRRPDLLPRRVATADELVALCVKNGRERALAVALCKRAFNDSAFGRPDRALADLRRAAVLADRHHLAPASLVIHLATAVLRQAAGDWAGCEQALQAAEVLQATVSMAGAGIGLGVRATALLGQGRLAEYEPVLRAAPPVHPALRELHALSLLAAGRPEQARELLGPWSEQPELTWDYLWLTGTVLRAHVWSELGDPTAVSDLRRLLAPYADRIADGAMAAAFLGSVRHALAVLAMAAGEPAVARAEAQAARDLHARLGWGPWEQRSQRVLDQAGTRTAG